MSKGKRVGYIRVSTTEQNPERQLENISLDKKFIDYASSRTLERPQLQSLLDYCREDDVIFVHSMDRLARNARELRDVVDALIAKGIQVHFCKENLHFDGSENSMSKLLLSIMAAFAEFEYEFNRERQREGIEIAKRAGKYKGRQRKVAKYRLHEVKEKIDSCRSRSQMARDLGIARSTLYKYMREIRVEDKEIENRTQEVLRVKNDE